jgi:hypothetical protein
MILHGVTVTSGIGYYASLLLVAIAIAIAIEEREGVGVWPGGVRRPAVEIVSW